MDQNFQTSFIPKKPVVKEEPTNKPVGLFTIIALFFFVAMAIGSGAIYLYKKNLTKKVVDMEQALFLAKGRLEETRINELQELDKRLIASTEILSKHIAVTPIFQALQEITRKEIRFTKFSYELGTDQDQNSGRILVKLSGVARSYKEIALQAELFSIKNKLLIDPIFSNLSLDDKGNVLFDLEFLVDSSLVDYKQMLQKEMRVEADKAEGEVFEVNTP